MSLRQTHVARQIVQSLGSIPTVIILSQVIWRLNRLPSYHNPSPKDSFYKFHSPEELELAHANMLDFDHPDAIDMPMFASVSTLQISDRHSEFIFWMQCLSELKACKQSNIPVYSFSEHQRLEETKYLYGATIIISSSAFPPAESPG